MSYLVVTCKKCSNRKIVSLKGRSIPHLLKCPYCGSIIIVIESHFAIFDDYERAKTYWLKGRKSRTQAHAAGTTHNSSTIESRANSRKNIK